MDEAGEFAGVVVEAGEDRLQIGNASSAEAAANAIAA